MNLHIANVQNKLNSIKEYWQPIDIARFNQLTVKIAKLQGEYDWHNHKHEDKLLHVLSGQLFIVLRNETVEVNAGEVVVIPKNTDHKPFAPIEASVMFFEPTLS